MNNQYKLPPDPQHAIAKRIYPWEEYNITIILQWLYEQAKKTGFVGTFEDFKQRYGMYVASSDPQDIYDLIEIDNCYGGSFFIDTESTATITSYTVNKLYIHNWRNLQEIYYTKNTIIKDIQILNSPCVTGGILTDRSHGSYLLDTIEHVVIKDEELKYRKHYEAYNKDTNGETLYLPAATKIQVSSSNSSAKYMVCGSNICSLSPDDYYIGSVSGSSGGTLSRSNLQTDSSPYLSNDSNGNLVFNQRSGTGNYCMFPIYMPFVKTSSNAIISVKLVNSGTTSGASFKPCFAIYDCLTNKLVDRYLGTAVIATSEGATCTYSHSVSPNCILLCYFYCSSPVANSVTTFQELYYYYYDKSFPPSYTVDKPFIARKIVGNGTLASFEGINHIMSSSLNFHAKITIDYLNNKLDVATISDAGLMSTADKSKLAGIAAGATAVTVSNSLSDTSTTNALSAAQGKALNDQIASMLTKTSVYATVAANDVVAVNYPSGFTKTNCCVVGAYYLNIYNYKIFEDVSAVLMDSGVQIKNNNANERTCYVELIK